MTRFVLPTLITMLTSAPLSTAWAQDRAGAQLFESRCADCHVSPSDTRAPDRNAFLRQTPESILESITTGGMAVNATGLTDIEKGALSEYLAGRPFGSPLPGDAAAMPNRCGNTPFADPFEGPMWNGWGADLGNSRFQPGDAAGLSADEVPRLRLKWAFGFSGGRARYSQPTLAGGRVYIAAGNGFVYSLDAETGCVYWSFNAQASVRTAISIGPVTGAGATRFAVYFGDASSNVYALDAESGRLVWTARADTHPRSRITGAPALYAGRLYVPVSSGEEGPAANLNYECCKFRGSLVAYDANTGQQIWKSYTIAEEPRPTRQNSRDVQQWAPAGAAIWSAPTIDVKRNLVYVATGNAYTSPAVSTSDAVLAFELETGRLAWVSQVTPNDAFLVGCGGNRRTDNCPEEAGPDFDFGNSPILRTLPDGQDIIVIGQKSGVAWGLDPDSEGALVWQHRVGRGSALGGMEWGSAADEELGYFPVADARYGLDGAGGLAAVRLGTGERVWFTRPPATHCAEAGRSCVPAQSAAITVIPGVVFSGTVDGVMRAFSTTDGRIIWEVDTVREYSAVNGVETRGGGLNGPGPTVAGGMLFMTSGYSGAAGGAPGNALLAFGLD